MQFKITLIFVFFTSLLFAQKNNKLEYFSISSDTVLFYLDNVGDITINSKAEFYRKTQISMQTFDLSNKVTDYYMNNQISYECEINNGFFDGKVNSYYKNGQLEYSGIFKKSFKDSIWNYYYQNGNLEKVISFSLDTPYVKEYYKKNGKIVFDNGNGKYKGKIISGYKQFTKYNISGNIIDGKMDDKWGWNNSNAIEYFDNGSFYKGSSYGLVYTSDPKISLNGYILNENVDIFKFIAIPETDENNYLFKQLLKYKNSNNLNTTLKIELNDYLLEINKENNILNYWCFVQFVITKDNHIENVLVYSNNEKITTNLQEFFEK
ncbi:MAG: hypothetical protein JXR51_00335 [Bacteroidales bacterium]|nr:hypothetical protein [Bacteroidales bacterium]MBN2755587.1 hypothetical protein [Bacteroidales bacterium]